MLFNSGVFMLFLPLVLLIYYSLPAKHRHIWLLIASYIFYMNWSRRYALLLLFSTLATYLCGLGISYAQQRSRPRLARGVLVLDLLINLGILFVFKYFNFAFESLGTVFTAIGLSADALPHIRVHLPVGISFYTFQALGYTIDVYRGDIHAEKDFCRYALFVSFFPQLVAGPIERSRNLLVQLRETKPFSLNRARDGILLMLWGYFLKLVLADRAAIVVNTVWGNISEYGGFYLIVASILFAFQIYCDFAGYSIIAQGVAKIFGIQLMDNFNAPYLATSVADFWRRWHISLSYWFRDYLYFPLGGNRKGFTRRCLNLLIVFGVSGLWHGANWTYVIWGLLNGAFQIIGMFTKTLSLKIRSLLRIPSNCITRKLFHRLITFILIDLTWIFFRSTTLSESLQILKSILHANNPEILFDGSLFQLGISAPSFILLILSILLLMAVDICREHGVILRQKIQTQDFWFRAMAIAFSALFILIFGIWGSGYSESGFIYFQF